jgi:hypothetical protein
MERKETAAKIAGLPPLTDADKETIAKLREIVKQQPGVIDMIDERAYQLFRWDETNSTHIKAHVDSYIALALGYLGRATPTPYRNEFHNTRNMLVKSAAVILQAVNHIDEKRL